MTRDVKIHTAVCIFGFLIVAGIGTLAGIYICAALGITLAIYAWEAAQASAVGYNLTTLKVKYNFTLGWNPLGWSRNKLMEFGIPALTVLVLSVFITIVKQF